MESKIEGEVFSVYLKVSVKDSGIGIVEEDLFQFFDCYFQVDIGVEVLESLGSGVIVRSGVGLVFVV